VESCGSSILSGEFQGGDLPDVRERLFVRLNLEEYLKK
jgi:hypothetical protein